MADRLWIKGLNGKRALRGRVRVGGAKNNALKIIASSILFRNGLNITNVPVIKDVDSMVELLSYSGASINRSVSFALHLLPRPRAKTNLPEEIAKRLRASIALIGPVLARYGKVSFPHPGGCVIGPRPIDLFLSSFEKMGAKVEHKGNRYHLSVPNKKLHGATIFFKNQSVTATETLLMTAVLASGKTILKNCALEPEVSHLADYLSSAGAKIRGAGTPTIEIIGGGLLSSSKPFKVMPDRIEAGSFLILAALAGEDVEIDGCNPSHLEALLEILRESGVPLEVGKNYIRVAPKTSPSLTSINIKTHEYPGFPTDLQAAMVVYSTQVKGEATVFETIFEGRLNYVEELTRMGADIKVFNPHQAQIKGPTILRGRELESPDLRAGLAFIIAAAIARGESIIHNVNNIDRGYENIEGKLTNLWLDIKRI